MKYIRLLNKHQMENGANNCNDGRKKGCGIKIYEFCFFNMWSLRHVRKIYMKMSSEKKHIYGSEDWKGWLDLRYRVMNYLY